VSQIFIDGGEFLIIHSSERTPRHLFADLLTVGIDSGAHGGDKFRKVPLLDEIEIRSERPPPSAKPGPDQQCGSGNHC